MAKQDEKQIAVFSDLLAENRGRLFGYLYSMLHNLSDAEDLFQQTTVLMWEKFSEFQPGTDFGSWALKIAYYNVKNFQRSQDRQRRFFSEAVMEKVAESYTQVDGDANQRLEALEECVRKLSAENQKMLKMRYAEGVPIARLAELRGKTEAAMTMALSRVRKSLFRCITSRNAIG